MPLASTADLVTKARASGRGVAAFNVITLEHAEAIVAGAEAVSTPVILQISQNAVKFHNGQLEPIAAASAALARAARVDVALHLDHIEDTELLRRSVEVGTGVGMGSVMFDASTLNYADNVAATRRAARWAHDNGMWVEAELGEVGGKNGAHAPGARTDPGEAASFVKETCVDALAVAVGSSHAMTSRTAQLDHDLIARIAAAVAVPLVLHGSSGVPDGELSAAIRSGIVKINVGTVLNVALTGAVREWLDDHPGSVDPRGYLAAARDRVADIVGRVLIAVGG